MTKDEILAMEPGRELDALVAVNLFGWFWKDGKLYSSSREDWTEEELSRWSGSEPDPYSSDTSAAWEIVEHFKSKGYLFAVKNLVGGKYEFSLTDWGGMCSTFSGQGDTAPLAICRAALMATFGGTKG